MENTGITFDRQRFDCAWNRVNPAERPQPAPYMGGAGYTAADQSVYNAANDRGIYGAPSDPSLYGAANNPGLYNAANSRSPYGAAAYDPNMRGMPVPYTATAPDSADAIALRSLMDREAEDFALYQALSRKLRGSAGETLAKSAADERRHLKKLQVEYYLLTGDTYCPAAACPRVFSAADTLREQYGRELRGHSEYMDASSRTARSGLSELHKSISEDEAVHARRIRCILETLMGDPSRRDV